MEKFRKDIKVKKERAILVAAVIRDGRPNDNLAELTALAQSAGAVIVDRFQQKINRPNTTRYIGKGKAEELAERVKRFDADVVIFDNDLSPRQIRELEEIVGIKILDRSELILDIFATRAQTKQAKLQVSLAQLEYTYPRLARMWSHLDSVAGAAGGTAAGAVGGIGTRGTGEQQLEIDRRLVQKRITELKRQLEQIDKRKIREIKARKKLFKVCLVGYTNAGKSTLLNKLTGSDVLVEDMLFATLDTKTRKWTPAAGVDIMLSDTVGFVRKLPHHLVASFKATLEEAVNADLLLHVIDVSNPDALLQVRSVDSVLTQIGCGKKETMKIFNKIDSLKDMRTFEMLQTLFPQGLSVSAKKGSGLEELSQKITDIYNGDNIRLNVQISASNGRIQSFICTHGKIISQQYAENEVSIDFEIGKNLLAQLNKLGPEKVEIKN